LPFIQVHNRYKLKVNPSQVQWGERVKLARYCDVRIESILLDVNKKRILGSSW
jgi:hypothetical protein